MRSRKQKRGDLLLTTLIDLLVQILFLFLLMIAVVNLAGSKSQKRALEAKAVEEALGIPMATIVEKWRRLVDPDTLQAEQKTFLAQKLDYERLKRLEAQLKQRELHVEKLEKDLGNALGFRPCWGSNGKAVDGIFKVKLSDNGIVVTKSWPASRDEEAKLLAIPNDSLDRILSSQSFRAAFKGVFDASRRANCAYYVAIEDATQSAEKGFEYSQAVEGYFYPLKKSRVAP